MKEYKLSQLLEIKNGKDHKELPNGDYPVFGSGGVMRYVNEYLYDKPSILLPRKGSLNNIQYCDVPFWTVDTLYYTEVNEKLACPYYLYRYLHLLDLSGLDTGTGVPSMTFDSYYNIKVILPEIEEQKRVASVLQNLDYKIALNRQINDNLEAMAKQLYDYWFVQFDFPNEEGRPYKSSGGAMVWNDKLKREIPKGWTSAKIKDAAHTYSGGTPTSTNSKYYDGGNIPWINSGELNNPIITSTTNYITEEGLNNSSAKLYPQDTVLVALYGATAGKVSLLSFEACSNQAVCGVIPQNKIMTTYIRYYLSSLYEHFITLSSGSARDNISQDTIKNTILPIPQEKILKEYSDSVVPIISKIIANQKEIENLTKQRDELLPLLMNGQATVNYHLSVLFITKIMLYYKETNINFRYERNNNTKRFRWNESGSVS